jgi:uncharacterized protein (DUF1786 family)
MRILAVDVGTGTQDILVFDTTGPVENCVKLVTPSATTIAARRIRRATEAKQPVVLTGVIQGGGPCHWALEDHLRAGLPAFATAEAAATFDDELDKVSAMGVTLVSDDEALRQPGEHIELGDLDLEAIRAALGAFDVSGSFDAYAVGCLDHGSSPAGYSDRLFRFDHLRRVVESENDLRAFAYLPDEVPAYLTRARSLLRCLDAAPYVGAHSPAPSHASTSKSLPTLFLDTGPAAALGALQDPSVAAYEEQLVLNLGNMHALAFHLHGPKILSLYEHHTGEMTTGQIEDFTKRLVMGDLRHEDVFNTKGHGVFYADQAGEQKNSSSAPQSSSRAEAVRFNPPSRTPVRPELVEGRTETKPFLAVTGPQRNRLRGSALAPYFAAPHGDMMLSGCFGMVRAFAYRYPEHSEEIERALSA